jgi:hypothetical protein
MDRTAWRVHIADLVDEAESILEHELLVDERLEDLVEPLSQVIVLGLDY